MKFQIFNFKFLISNKSRAPQAGFTILETVIVVAIFLTLIALISPAIFNIQSSSTKDSITETLLADIKNQQIKSMTGDTEGRGTPDFYGVYIQPSYYVLFHGQNYSPSEPTNFTTQIDNQFTLTTTFTQTQIVFATQSGEINGFIPAQNSITVQEIRTGQQKVIQLNKYGTITSVN